MPAQLGLWVYNSKNYFLGFLYHNTCCAQEGQPIFLKKPFLGHPNHYPHVRYGWSISPLQLPSLSSLSLPSSSPYKVWGIPFPSPWITGNTTHIGCCHPWNWIHRRYEENIKLSQTIGFGNKCGQLYHLANTQNTLLDPMGFSWATQTCAKMLTALAFHYLFMFI